MTGDVALRPLDVADVCAAFAASLHGAGVPVTPEQTTRLANAVSQLAPYTGREWFWLARVTLVSERAHLVVFDAVFEQVFSGRADHADRGEQHAPPVPGSPRAEPGSRTAPADRPNSAGASAPSPRPPTAGDDAGEPGTSSAVEMTASAEERLGERDLAGCSAEELEQIGRLVRDLALAPPMRRTHRRRRASAGDSLDVRATLRRAHRSGGDPVRWARRRATIRPRPVVMIADVSGSMERYSRAYLVLLHAAAHAIRAEAYVFSTRLTRVTSLLRRHGADFALSRAGRATPDWAGGTRIGDSLAAFLDTDGRRGVARGAVVVILSDGWEAGDAARLGEQMERLARLAHHVIWVNPRAQSAHYEPLVAGMKAAWPHVDTFLSGHSLTAMRDVVTAIGAATGRSGSR